MNPWYNFNWIKISLFNLLIVAFIGVLMRYKIGFEFPFLDQDHLHHAHSHFAFSGWISLLLMQLMVHYLKLKKQDLNVNQFNKILFAQCVCAYGMLTTFAIQGYGLYSITFSSSSFLFSIIFCFYFFYHIKNRLHEASTRWFFVSLVFNLLSALGTLYLSYLMASKHIAQHAYLASVYWYLHFQYNGWFFFACGGLFVDYLQRMNIDIKGLKTVFLLCAMGCIPAYGLSILWMNLPVFIYLFVVLAAIAQFIALILFIRFIVRIKNLSISTHLFGKLLLLVVIIALSIKITLQLGSTIPAVSNLAFGFRPIVIAYLHLVLLAFTTVFLLTYLWLNNLIDQNKKSIFGLSLFVIGIILNELLLAIQGIASLDYIPVPYVNEILFGVSLIIFISLIVVVQVNIKSTPSII